MSNARQLAANLPREGGLSNRNLIINGAMQVAQRGTSNGPNATNGVLSLDRWYANSSGGTKTISQETFASGQTDVPDFPKNYMRLAVTTGDNNLGVHQRVEDVTVLGGKTVTLSFWAKGTNPAGGSFVSSWIQNFGSGGSTTVETEAKSGIVLTSTWQKFTITFDVPSVSGKTIGTSSYTWVELLRQPATDTGTAGWTADIAQVQLEVGDTATPFEHRSYGDELARCQRYIYRINGHSVDQKQVGSGYFYSSTQMRIMVNFPVTMRAEPSVSSNSLDALFDTSNDAAVSISSSLDEGTTTYGLNVGSISTSSIGNGGILRLHNVASSYIEFDAEL